MPEPITNKPSLREQCSDSTAQALKESRSQLIEKIIADAIQENPPLSQVDTSRLQQVVRNSLEEIEKLKTIAKKHEQLLRQGELPWPLETIRKIKALWVLSGPGLYRQAFKDDRYRDKPWAAFMGKHRLTYAGLLARRFAEAKRGVSYARVGKGSISPMKPDIRNLIADEAPFILFNGRPDENLDVRSIVSEERNIIPPEKVWITGKSIDKTIDQITDLTLPPNLALNPDDKIGVISHAPHLMRFGHMLNRFRDQSPFPEGITIKALPLSSPSNSQEYTNQEIRGLLYYIFISGEATAEPYPYAIY